jgi:hypothetical protein
MVAKSLMRINTRFKSSEKFLKTQDVAVLRDSYRVNREIEIGNIIVVVCVND